MNREHVIRRVLYASGLAFVIVGLWVGVGVNTRLDALPTVSR